MTSSSNKAINYCIYKIQFKGGVSTAGAALGIYSGSYKKRQPDFLNHLFGHKKRFYPEEQDRLRGWVLTRI
jgi:hypothetical protein